METSTQQGLGPVKACVDAHAWASVHTLHTCIHCLFLVTGDPNLTPLSQYGSLTLNANVTLLTWPKHIRYKRMDLVLLIVN